MADNINSRKSQIKQVNSSDEPAAIAELLRDLRALKKEKTTLAQTEEAALRHFTDCLVSEWAISMDITRNEAQQQFEDLIRLGREQAADNS